MKNLFERALVFSWPLLVLALVLPCSRVIAEESEMEMMGGQASAALTWDFEHVEPGTLPAGWKAEATGRQEPLAHWQVAEVPDAHSGSRVLALTETRHGSASTFNLCWTRAVSFRDGTIKVWFRPVKGRIDQGGGIMWRVKDHDNYYVARFNPLEDNFRIYYVKNGVRRMIQSAGVSLRPGWHSMTIVQEGDRFQCLLDGRRLLQGRDSHFKGPGGVGLWTKADAATSFDDFQVVRKEP